MKTLLTCITLACLATACRRSLVHGVQPTREQLDEAHDVAVKASPPQFEATYASLTAKLGNPKKKGDHFEWYAEDDGKCWSLSVSKTKDDNLVASDVKETAMSNCQ